MTDYVKNIAFSDNALSIHKLFEQQAVLTPSAVAVIFNKVSLTYGELNAKTDLFASQILIECSEQPIIGISTTRSLEMVVGVLAILKSGKAYLPLDPKFPKERLEKIVEESKLEYVVVGNLEEHEVFDSLALTTVSFNAKAENVKHSKPPSLAYVLYTSGSTGRPKGVCMGHQALVNLLLWQKENSIASTATRTLQFAPLGFDVSFQEIFSTLITGGVLLLIEDDLRLDPVRLLKFIDEQSINRLFLPFVALQHLAEVAEANSHFPQCLQEVITAGEQLKITPQIKQFFSSIKNCTLYNQYGPTEAHVVTELKLRGNTSDWDLLPSIGHPIANTDIYILDEQLKIITDGRVGELCISGACLAEGYLNRNDLTAEKFVQWQHPQKGLIRIYRTGDVANYQADGTIQFLGRKDDQVKIRGYRIELAEIEVALNHLPQIQQAAVVAKEMIGGQTTLVAYLISKNASRNTTVIRKQLERQLPDYMMPSLFVWLDDFPYTSSGKIDKKALPMPTSQRPDLDVILREPETLAEKNLTDVWKELLNLEEIGTDDNFFELGGNSLLAIKSVVRLKQLHNYDLPVTKLYQHRTIKNIALFLENKAQEIANQKRKLNKKNGGVAVIGLAGRFPGAESVEELLSLLREGGEAISFFPKEELHQSLHKHLGKDGYVSGRGIISGAESFDAAFFGINPKVAELMDPQQRIFLEISWEVLEKTGHLPANYNGTVGVFAGCGNNSYYINNVLPNTDKVNQVGGFQVMTINEKDYIATRTAYELDLKGPAISVHTGCSTSLLAIAQAVENIRSGRCDVAIAGGVSVTAPIKSGYYYEEGAIFSKDGHCRPFDAEATGTVFSDGAGVVLLKDLQQAQNDGDTIYAIIKGVGYNNDGGAKASFTAPDTVGQAGAIIQALEDAQIEPSSLSYIEAHGTATPLGDPIEIEGLKLAYGEGQANSIALGSIKSNLGHLTAAAGVAGFIKTVLSLFYKELFPSVNYKTPNPNLNLEKSPFYVNTERRKWDSAGIRRAGVSSFGVGGTNVHTIIEEYKADEKQSSEGKPLHLITWSAKSEESREGYASKLFKYLGENKDSNLADLAYTLQCYRMPFASRQFVVVANTEELISQLNILSTQDAKTVKEQVREVVFMFPGQGSQYTYMGKQLYETEPVFKEAVDECAVILQEYLHEDIRQAIFPKAKSDSAEERLKNTLYAQPALFSVSYALAKLWMSWGIQPRGFVGHSVGEFVAAHLAGVFNLNDALKLIAVRGKMMSEMPAGSMISVRTNRENIESLLTTKLSLAAINSPQLCVVAGPSNEIEIFSKKLNEQGVPNKVLQTSHAFHSWMMDPVIAPFREVVQSIKLNAPNVPITSTVTGRLLNDKEATDVNYWSEHLRSTVRFADAIKTIGEATGRLLLEVGPRNVTATLARQQLQEKSISVISSLESADAEYRSLLKALGQLWINGVQVNWPAFYKGQERHKLSLPTYAFNKKVCWVEPPLLSVIQENIAHHKPHIKSEIENLPPEQLTIMRQEIIISKLKELFENASGLDITSDDYDASFIQLGLDSLLLTQVATTLKNEFNVPVTFRMLNEEYNSVNLLSDYLDKQLPAHMFKPQVAKPKISDAPTPVVNSITQNEIVVNDTSLGLIAQQLQILAKQVALLQGGGSVAPKTIELLKSESTNINTNQNNLTADEEKEIKKPFGATARIERQASILNDIQRDFLSSLIEKYVAKTKRSKEYTQQHRAYMSDPRVVTGFKPITKELVYPIVINKSKGSRMWDLDGNEYIDALNGFGASLLGHQPDFIKKAMLQQIEKGFEVGPQHDLSGDVCKLVCEFTNFDRAALCNTGSEAVMGTMRIARTVTGRSLIVAFSGSYHGINDEVIVRGTKKLKSFPAAPGIMPEAVENMLILDYGTQESLEIIRERKQEIAAVLVEPVQSRRPDFQPIDFLKKVRQITTECGAALIFDEVITGFRMHPGGAQALFGVKADIASYGKVIGGGLSIGVIAGTKQFMDALDGGFWKFGDDSIPEAGVTYFAGTFVRHPLALATTKASLEYMKAKGPALQEGINSKTKKLANSINSFCTEYDLPVHVVSFGSLWKIIFKKEILCSELLFTLMRFKGIHILDLFPCYLTEAHTDEDVDFIIQSFKESISELIEAEIIPVDKNLLSLAVNGIDEHPPLPGARLGRDKDGNPAWFIEDPQSPGKYLQLELHQN